MLSTKKSRTNGITLIALVITIIVLLILAGVTITTITGQNGILTKATEAKNKNEATTLEEKIRLAISAAQIGENVYQELTTENLGTELIKDGTQAIVSDNEDGTKHILFLDEKKEYKLDNNGNIEDLRINFDDKYVASSSQNKGVIGIGTDGKSVNMDLWEYTLLDNQTFGLNDKNSLEDINKNKGYLGNFDQGKIIGTVPQYISIDNGETFKPVTDLFATFCEIPEITIMPTIPNTVINLNNTFIRCQNLKILTNIPSSVQHLGSTFKGCISIEKAMEIPNSVVNIDGIFSGCTNLKYGPSNIPESVTNMQLSFYDCVNLTGKIIVNANVTGYPVVSVDSNDFYRCFYGATLKENNVELKVFLKEETYKLFNEQIVKVFNSNESNIILQLA